MENKKRLIDVSDWERYYNARKQSLEVYEPYYDGYEDALDHVDDWMDAQPTVDAVEVVHGRWIDGMRCSECGQVDWTKPNYCPNCGAKMDGERKDNKHR